PGSTSLAASILSGNRSKTSLSLRCCTSLAFLPQSYNASGLCPFLTTNAYLGEDKKGKKFVFFLEGEVGCFNLIDVYAHRRGKLTVKTYYHTKKGVSQSAMNLLAQTSETYGATLSVANIPILLKSK
ncbi:MAG: hypothetical protein IJ394_05670, partial [Bacteroidales bacterium]|nr:hypothetical protein [Bacteroidales bacterium]